jgi:hypothetical protein
MRSLIKIDILSRIGGGDWKQLTWLPAKLLILLLILLASSQKSKAQQTLTYTDEICHRAKAL